MMRGRIMAFAVLCIVIVVGAVGYLVAARVESSAPGPNGAGGAASAEPADLSGPYIAFKRTELDQFHRTVGIVPFDDPSAVPAATGLVCDRIHLSRFGGICLETTADALPTAQVKLLGPDLTVAHTLTTSGNPSRARVSADGRWAASTTFVFGHSYADTSFSTQTEIYDTAAAVSLGNLEDWALTGIDGKPFEAIDTNIWGVTFAPDSDTFYATVRASDQIRLVRGDIPSRSMAMLDVSAECPSLSPDGQLLAYKSATGPGTWQVRVRSVADGSEVVIDDSRSVDDQIEWLDADRVAYGVYRETGGAVTDVWQAPADGSAPARPFIEAAWSPTAVR